MPESEWNFSLMCSVILSIYTGRKCDVYLSVNSKLHSPGQSPGIRHYEFSVGPILVLGGKNGAQTPHPRDIYRRNEKWKRKLFQMPLAIPPIWRQIPQPNINYRVASNSVPRGTSTCQMSGVCPGECWCFFLIGTLDRKRWQFLARWRS